MKNALLIILALFIFIQFIQTEKTNPVSNKKLEIKAPAEIKKILRRACYDCHSNETSWPWYSYIAPMSWSIGSHVKNGRAWVNYSIWESYSQKEKKDKLKETYRAVYAAMPIGSYTYFHASAKLTKEERESVREWIKSISKF